MNRFIYASLVFLSSVSLHASDGGSVTGNGGDVIVCEGKKPILLDVYELGLFESRQPKFSSGDVPARSRVEDVLARVAKLAPNTADIWRHYLKEIEANLVWTDEALVDIPDSQHTVLPTGCHLEQVAIQERTAGQLKVTINRQLWNAMDEDNRAALLLHEILYTDALLLGERDSVHSRQLNLVLLGLNKTEQEFADALRSRGFPFEIRTQQGEAIFYHRQFYGNAPTTAPNQTVRDACGFASKIGVRLNCRGYFGQMDIVIQNGLIKAFNDNSGGHDIGLPFRVRGADFYDGTLYLAQEIEIDFVGYKFVCSAYAKAQLYPHDILAPGRFRFQDGRLKSCEGSPALSGGKMNQRLRLSDLSLQGSFQRVDFRWDFSGNKPRGYGIKLVSKSDYGRKLEKSVGGDPALQFLSIEENYDENSVLFEQILNREPVAVAIDYQNCNIDGRLKYFVKEAVWKFAGAKFKNSCRVRVGTQAFTVREIMLSGENSFSELDLVNEAHLGIGDRSQGAWFNGPLVIAKNQGVLSGRLSQPAELSVRFEGKTLNRVVPTDFHIEVRADGIYVPEEKNRSHLGSGRGFSNFYEVKFNRDPKKNETLRFPLANGAAVLIFNEALLDKDLSLLAGLTAESVVLPICQKNAPDFSDVTVITQRVQSNLGFVHDKASGRPKLNECFWTFPIKE